jgi:hypothetical protein
MNLPPKKVCEECRAFNAKMEEITAPLDVSIPEVNAAVAANNKPLSRSLRDEVIKVRDELRSVSSAYVSRLGKHESVPN